jgi:hypothetical protein
MLCCVVGSAAPDISKDCGTFIYESRSPRRIIYNFFYLLSLGSSTLKQINKASHAPVSDSHTLILLRCIKTLFHTA